MTSYVWRYIPVLGMSKQHKDLNLTHVLQVRYSGSDATASHRLLGTSEVLEMILLHLPIRDLLLAQRTCKWLKSVITESPPLQRALFFKPVYALPAEDFRMGKACCTEHQLLPGDLLVCNSKLRVYGNPLFEWAFGTAEGEEEQSRDKELELPPAFAYRKASWRRMFITQPPLPRVTIEWELDGPHPSGRAACTFRDIREEGGVRLGTFWTHVKALDDDTMYGDQTIDVRSREKWEEWVGEESLAELMAEARKRRT